MSWVRRGRPFARWGVHPGNALDQTEPGELRAGALECDEPIRALLETLLPDFILAFTFFAALVYAVLGRRFGRHKPAVAMSGSIGLALAVGLVWWERDHGWSIRSLGPLAIAFALIILVIVV